MSAKVLSKAAAKEAKIDLIEDGRGTQAVHDAVVAMRAARRSGSANTKSKAEVDLSGAKPWRQKGTGRARAGYKYRRFGGAAASFLARSRAIIRRKLESPFVDSLFEKR